MIDAIRGLVRPLCTFAFVAALIYMAVAGKIEPKDFLPIAVMVVTFWFSTREKNKENGG